MFLLLHVRILEEALVSQKKKKEIRGSRVYLYLGCGIFLCISEEAVGVCVRVRTGYFGFLGISV